MDDTAKKVASSIHQCLIASGIGRRPSKALDDERQGMQRMAHHVACSFLADINEQDREGFHAEFMRACGLYFSPTYQSGDTP